MDRRLRRRWLRAEPDEAAHVVDEVGEADLHGRPGKTEGADDEAHRPLLPGEDMFDAGADLRSRGVRPRRSLRHCLPAGFLRRMRLVLLTNRQRDAVVLGS